MQPKKAKSLSNRLLSRVVITGFIILLQFIWIALIAFGLSSISKYIAFLVQFLSLLVIVYIIGTDSNSSVKITWILLLAFIPAVGAPLYMLFGNKYPGRSLHKKMTITSEKLRPNLTFNKHYIKEVEKIQPHIAGKFRYLENHCDFPVYRNTAIKYFSLGDHMFKCMLEDLKAARHHIFLEYFIISPGKMWQSILDVLIEKAKSGIDVRIIYDDFGCVRTLHSSFPLTMQKHGIKTVAFNRFIPLLSAVMNHRDHRKILVIDSEIAYTGGINIADEYINEHQRFGHWKDNGIRLQGDGAFGLTMMFFHMWDTLQKAQDDIPLYKQQATPLPQSNSSQGFIQPFADSPLDFEDVAENLYLDIIGSSCKYLFIFTPYLIINSSMSNALRRAAKRDVDVRIITPATPDKKLIHRMTRSNYLPLIRDGVKIYEYAPGFLHAKGYVADDEICVVGSINMDFRSLNLHFECGILIHDTEFISDMKQDFLQTQQLSNQFTQDDCKTSFIGMLCDAIMRVFSPLM